MSTQQSNIIATKKEANFMFDFLAGGIAGAISKTCTPPIERVKLLIQTQDANPEIISGKVPRYTGIINCFSRVSSEQGIGAFWRGNTVNVLRYFPTQACNLAFKDTIKQQFPKYSTKTDFGSALAVNIASGGSAAAITLCFVYPLDFARTRLASDVGKTRQFNGLIDCLTKTLKAGGMGAVYGGFGVSVVGIVPYRGTQFGLFDTMNSMNPYKDGAIGLISKFFIAQFSVIAGAQVSYPFDTVRRRLQMQSGSPQEQWLYSGTADCFAKIIKNEGPAALFKGAGANVLRTVGAALVLVLYDEIRTAFGY